MTKIVRLRTTLRARRRRAYHHPAHAPGACRGCDQARAREVEKRSEMAVSALISHHWRPTWL